MNDIEITPSNFKEKVIEKSKEVPVVVDFWASWCMSCLMLSPMVEKVVEEYNGKIILTKLNIDENQVLKRKFNVVKIPDIKIFKNGKVIDGFTGSISESEIKKWIDKHL